MKKYLALAVLACVGAFSAAGAYAGDAPSYTIGKTFPVAGNERWDYIAVDPVAHRLYVPRSSMTQVIDEATGAVIATIPTRGPHGTALVPEFHRGFITTATGVVVFDTQTNKTLMTVKADEGPDGIVYDPFSKTVFCMCGEAGTAVAIPASIAANAGACPSIDLGGKPETPVSDGAGHLFINLEDQSQIAVVDTRTLKVTAQWPLAPGEGPSGLAIDPATHRLFSGCHSKQLVIMNSDTGAVVGQAPIGSGVDACGFDPGTKLAFASCSDGTLAVVHEDDANKFTPLPTVKTVPGARTMTIDLLTHAIYLPTAIMLPPLQSAPKPAATMPAGATTQPTTRPKRVRMRMQAGSFEIIELSPSTPAAP